MPKLITWLRDFHTGKLRAYYYFESTGHVPTWKPITSHVLHEPKDWPGETVGRYTVGKLVGLGFKVVNSRTVACNIPAGTIHPS